MAMMPMSDRKCTLVLRRKGFRRLVVPATPG